MLLCSPVQFAPNQTFYSSPVDWLVPSVFLVLGKKKNKQTLLFHCFGSAGLLFASPRDDGLHYYFMCIEVGKYYNYNWCLFWVFLFHWQETASSYTAEKFIHGSQYQFAGLYVLWGEKTFCSEWFFYISFMALTLLNEMLTKIFQTVFKNSRS